MLQYISEHFTTFVHITGKDPRHAAADALSRATPFMTSIPAPPPTDPASSLKEEKGVGSIATNLNHVEPPAPHVHSDTSQDTSQKRDSGSVALNPAPSRTTPLGNRSMVMLHARAYTTVHIAHR